MGESPTLPFFFIKSPLVEVAAVILPVMSRQAMPTVSWPE